MQVITSKDNELVKQIKKLKDKKNRDSQGKYMIEGIKIIKEAMEEEATIDTIVVCEECLQDGTLDQKMLYEIAKYPCIYVTKKVFDSMTDVNNPQGVLAIIQKQESKQEIDFTQDVIVILDGIQDPGNLGTIIRTVDSCNLKQIILSSTTADPYNPKVVRSTMGAIFRVNMIQTDTLADTIKGIKKHQFEVLATSLEAKQSMYDVSYHKKAIIIGNEANGVSEEILALADKQVTIPMLGKTESLNASVATGIMLYEYIRQKLKE